MVLAMDVGNSALKVARVEGGLVGDVRRIATGELPPRADLVEVLTGLGAADDEAGIVLVSVVPDWTEQVMHAAVRLGVPLLVADHETVPIEVRLDHPERVGADRLIDAYAAVRLHGRPVIVVDMGTATTVDAVDSSGAFVGGAIIPGLALGIEALASRTAQLPRVEPSPPDRAIGVDTPSAIRSGTVLGHVGAIREVVSRIGRELVTGRGRRPRVVVTGGFAGAPWAGIFTRDDGPGLGPIADVLDQDLTLRGLALLHEQVAQVHA